MDEFEWAGSRLANSVGEIVQWDERDDSYKIKFTDGSDTWFKFYEFEVVNFELDSVESAVNYLISKGYEVTLNKKG